MKYITHYTTSLVLFFRDRRRVASSIYQILERIHDYANALMGMYIISIAISFFVSSSIPQHAKHILLYVHYAAFTLFVLYLLTRYVFLRRPLRGRQWKSAFETEDFTNVAQKYLYDKETIYENQCRMQYTFATSKELINISTRLNYDGYYNTQFSVPVFTIYRRNYSISRKNPKTFMIILNPLINYTKPLGFSCVLPLNGAATRAYLDGHIMDSALRAEYITYENEKVESIILFSFHVERSFSKYRNKVSAYYFGFAFQFIIFHLMEVARISLANDTTPIYVQSENGKILDLYKHLGFRSVGLITGDGCDLMCTTLDEMRQKIGKAELISVGTMGQISG